LTLPRFRDRPSTYLPVTEKYFCASNNDCVTEYNINDSIQLHRRVKSSAEYVDDIDKLLSTLKNIKTCPTCDRRQEDMGEEKRL